jgi:hypothetical protein
MKLKKYFLNLKKKMKKIKIFYYKLLEGKRLWTPILDPDWE